MKKLDNLKKLPKKPSTVPKTSGFWRKLKRLFRVSPTTYDYKKSDYPVIIHHWAQIQPLIFKFKLLQIDLTNQDFWKATGLIWNKDLDDWGKLNACAFNKINFHKEQFTKQILTLKLTFLEQELLKVINKHWSIIVDTLKDFNDFADLSKRDFWKATNLNWNKDLKDNFQLNETSQKKLGFNTSYKSLLAFFQINIHFLLKKLNQIILDYWNAISEDFAQVNHDVWQLEMFTPYAQSGLESNCFEINGRLKSPKIYNLLVAHKINFSAIKKITTQSLKLFVLQKLVNNWKQKNAPLMKRIKVADFSLDLIENWTKTNLNLNVDFNDQGCFNDQGIKKMREYDFKTIIDIYQNITFTFLLKFFQNQILDYWSSLRPYIEKLLVLKNTFFQSSQWMELKLNYENDLETDASIKKSVFEQIHGWEILRLKVFLNLDVKFFNKLIIEQITLHWKKIRFILEKILVFDESCLSQHPKWKQAGFHIDLDLQKNADLLLSALQNVINFSVKQLSAILKLNLPFLKKMFIAMIDEHWFSLAPVLKVVKKEKLNFSDQDFWVLTNLNWETDLKPNGYLTNETINALPNKTVQQIRAIKGLTKEKIRALLELILEKRKEIQKQTTKSKTKIGVWTHLKFFFGWAEAERSLQNRLEQKTSLNDSQMHDTILDYKTYKKQSKIFHKLRKKYSKKVISYQDIIATGEANIQPNRYIIELKNVSKYFLTEKIVNQVVCSVNLQIKKGDFLVILGPSGAGKSTLLNLISGVDSPDGGDLFVNGINLSLLDDGGLTDFRRKYIGFVFQQYNLLQNLTAKENIEIATSLLPKNRKPINMKELIDLLEISDLLDKYPFQLSGGQQQRFAIARALAKSPDILFCDEPTGALDQPMSKKVMQILFEINRKYKKTIIIVTHNRIFAQIAKTVIHFVNGKVAKFEEKQKPIEPKDIDFSY